MKNYICTNSSQEPKKIDCDLTHPLLRMLSKKKDAQEQERMPTKLKSNREESLPTTPIQNEKRKRNIIEKQKNLENKKMKKLEGNDLINLNGSSVTELIKLCKKYNLKTTGTKKELVLRLSKLK